MVCWQTSESFQPQVLKSSIRIVQSIGGADIARPAEFLLDASGTVRWVNLTESYKVRLTAEQVLKALDELGVTPAEQKK